jgi:hypothetical protein
VLRKPTRRRTYIILYNIVTAANLPLLSSPYPPPRRQNLPSKTRARSGGRAEITPPPSSAAIVAGDARARPRPPYIPIWQPSRPSPGGLPLHWHPRASSSPRRHPPAATRSPKPYRSSSRRPRPRSRSRRPRGTLSFLRGGRSSSSSTTPTPASSPRWIAAAAAPSCRSASQCPPGEVQLHLAHILLPPSFECMIRLRAFFFSFAPYTMRDAAVEG